MSQLQSILEKYRSQSRTEREKGSYFRELIRTCFRYKATYADLYSSVWLHSDSPSPPTKAAASPKTPTSGPLKPWATPGIRWSFSCGW